MVRIVVFGDSIAWGSFDPMHGGWVHRLWLDACSRPGDTRLSEDINYTSVFNLSIGGEVVAGVRRRFDIEATARTPDIVVIAIGINDAAHEGSPATPMDNFVADYKVVIQKARRVAREIILVTPTNVDEARSEHDWLNDDIARYVDEVRRIGTELKIHVVDVFGSLMPSDLDPDGIHPGESGHQNCSKRSRRSYSMLLECERIASNNFIERASEYRYRERHTPPSKPTRTLSCYNSKRAFSYRRKL